uniref:RNA helicase n=1 Tax=Arion vulgaris TaxID=1028688 RepID=A0A0B7AUV5_9EUPU
MSEDWGELITQQEAGLTSKIDALTIKKEETSVDNAAKSGDKETKAPLAVVQTPTNSGDVPADKESETKEDGDEKATSKEELSMLHKLLHSGLVKSKADIEILRKDPTSPLHSVKSFEALHLKPELLKGVYDMGFNAPSKIQETALPALLVDPPCNMIAQSQSGTGKTAAFVLTMLSRVNSSQDHPQCLCLAPTYELALQIGDVTREMSKHMVGLSIIYAVRGERVARGERVNSHIIIGTPGTVMDWAFKFKVFDIKRIRVFVLDEADVMISLQGHQDQSYRLQKGLSPDCQMLLFSATYDTDVMSFAAKIIPNDPVIIKLRREEESLDNIKQFYIDCNSQDEKFKALSNIYGAISIGQSMIFCATRKTTSSLAEFMTSEGHAVGLLSGELPIETRAAIIKRFKDGKEKVLITTNVSARGIDVEQVTVVVNFDLPLTVDHKPDCETYLHRIGRTGRFGKNGIAINFVDGSRAMTTLKYIEKHFGRKIVKLDADDLDEIEKISA